MYKTIFIDWNGALSSSKFWWHLENSTRENNEIFERIEKSLFGNLRDLLNPWMLGKMSSEDVIRKVSQDSKLGYNKLFNEFVKSCKSMKLAPGNPIPIISKLRKKGVKVVIATDNMDSFNRWTYPKLKLFNFFDGCLNSCDIKAMKGHQSKNGKSLFFDKYLRSSGLKPKESVLIDDSEDNAGVISGFGIDYLKIESGVGLSPALKNLLSKY
jgi:FMN phosphatase YigB (HAD superfamily)